MANKTGIDLFTALLVLIEHFLSALLPFSQGLLLLAKRLTDQIYSVQKSHAAQKYVLLLLLALLLPWDDCHYSEI